MTRAACSWSRSAARRTGARCCTSNRPGADRGQPGDRALLETRATAADPVDQVAPRERDVLANHDLRAALADRDMIAAYLRQIRGAAPFELGTAPWSAGRYATGAPSRRRRCARVARMATRWARPGSTTWCSSTSRSARGTLRRAAGPRRADRRRRLRRRYHRLQRGPGAERHGAGDRRIGVSGDAFDARMIDAIVAPALGRGTRYRDEMGGEAPVPA